MAITSVQLNFRIPADLHDKLDEKVKETGESKTAIITKALEAYLKK